MRDTLYARQDALEDADLLKYAAELSLDSDRISRELAGHEYARRVEEDQTSGLDSGVSGTPTFYFDGTRDDGSTAWNQSGVIADTRSVAASRVRSSSSSA